MENVDRLREVHGAADDILRTLEAFGFEWDGQVLYQSTRAESYSDALARIDKLGLTFACACSRKEIAMAGRPGLEGPIYPGTCRGGIATGRVPRTIRLRIEASSLGFDDRVQGRMKQHLARDVGDFVLKRADGVHAYQLAVVVDDAFQGINQIMRGADLLGSTPRQIFLQRCLELPTPTYAHLPLALDAEGNKLSKSVASAPVEGRAPLPTLLQAWNFLGQPQMTDTPVDVREFWQQAFLQWDTKRIPALTGAGLPPRTDR